MSLQKKENKMVFSNASIPVASIINSIDTVKFGGLDLQPDYQREFIWSDEFKQTLMFSITRNYPIGIITIRVLDERNKTGAMQEVVDGQQRLTTIYNYIKNGFPIRGNHAKKIVNDLKTYFELAGETDEKLSKLIHKMDKHDNLRIFYDDLPVIIQKNISSFNIAMVQITNSDDEQIREYFRLLQNQERLRAGEIIKSMPSTNLEAILNRIHDKNKLLNIIGFADDRAEFDKIFYSILGLFDRKINFGITDKQIQEYAYNAEKPTTGIEYIERLIYQLNSIIHQYNDNEKILINTRKRFLKYFLLLAGFGYVDFKGQTADKLYNLKHIDDMLSAFFSAKANIVDEIFIDYSNEVKEELRLVALISKGAHSFDRVSNRMEILAYYINNETTIKSSGVRFENI